MSTPSSTPLCPWRPWLWAAALLLSACSRDKPEAAPAAPTPVKAAAPAPVAAARPAPPEGPSEDELLAFLSAEYERIRDAGGLPVTVTASGKSTVLQPRVYSLTKTGCRPVPRRPDELECSVVAMVTFREGDRKPGEHGERIYVRWDAAQGVWKAKK